MATRKTPEIEEKDEIMEETPAPVEAAPEVDYEELVLYTAPLTTLDAKPIFVGVNGETIRIQRGVPVMIKRKFYLALMDAQKQEMAAFMAQKNAQKDSFTAFGDL